MFDKSNIFDLTLLVPIYSCSLFSTQNPGNHTNKDPLKSNAFFASDKNLFYYNHRLLSTRYFLDYNRESRQIPTRRAIIVIHGKDKKLVKLLRHFFVIFFNEKENEHRLLNNFRQISFHLFNIKLKLNSDIIGFLILRMALNQGKCINTGEPAAVFGCSMLLKVVELIRPETTAAGLLFVFCHRDQRGKDEG